MNTRQGTTKMRQSGKSTAHLRKSVFRNSTFVLAIALYGLVNTTAVQAEQANPERLFTLRVLPLLKEKCLGCHGEKADDIKGDFDVRSRESLLKGGESEEPSVVPGKPEESSLYHAVMWDGLEMPPKENDRLTTKQTEYIHAWIKAGAPWPDQTTRNKILKAERSVKENDDGRIVETSGGLADDWTFRRYKPADIWAFEAVKKPQIPSGHGDNPIDAFINEKLADVKLNGAPEADPRTLIRRASYDLTGLPPTPKQISYFTKAWKTDSTQAWKELLSELLTSKHYGERWAQHWLDVVRYADTSGFSNDYERSNAWRYRDYVIRAFNKDKPFNEFIIEQIAGDEYRPKDPEALIATGFLRMGPFGTAMIPQEEIRQIFRDDLVHNVGQSFLSMPMRCCKCHDHKFDPIPTRDYYRMYAAFSATQPAELPAAFLPEENLSGLEDKKKLTAALLKYATGKRDAIHKKQEDAAKAWYAEHNLPYKKENARKNDPEDKKPPRHVGLTPEDTGRKKVREQDCWIWERRLERYEPLAQSVYNGKDKYLNARKMRPAKPDDKWQPASFILTGGSLESQGEKVVPGVLSGTGIPTQPGTEEPFILPEGINGRRLALAKWIANDANPLTARSYVNRIWHYHFGVGIVDTPNNFGAKGGKPSHRELLDWLTADFITNGWKTKRLHQLIMSSETYRRSGQHPDQDELDAADPNNRLLARFSPRRLTAEELRDTMLFVSGELNPDVGGLPIMPEINMEVALQPRMIQFSIAPAHQPSRTPAERNRRTIYTYRVRGQADPMLEIMNLPNPNESCEARDSAAVSPQAFTLMNSDTMTDRSIGFAAQVMKEHKDPKQQIRTAIQRAYGRKATRQEVKSLTVYLSKMNDYHATNSPKPVEYPKYVTRSLVEEFTGNPFTFEEWLNVYEDYVPDAKPWMVSAEVRALADVCLLLMNSNEFVYLY